MSENIPPSILDEEPAIPPPPGITSNFVSPENKAAGFYATASVFLAIALALFAARIYVKGFITRKATWDDCKGFLLSRRKSC